MLSLCHRGSQIDAGGRWDNCVYRLAIPLGMDNLGRVQLEKMNLYLALRIWAGKGVKFECDNEPVVLVVRSGKTGYLCKKYTHASAFDIEITVVHLPREANAMADLLSR